MQPAGIIGTTEQGPRMPSGNECSACGANIGMWAVFRAPLPNRIYCPHCGERLRYGDTTLIIAAAVAGIVLAIGASVLLAFLLEPVINPLPVVLGALVLGAVIVEVVFVFVLWYGTFRLESVEHPKNEWDEEEF
jgi:hypothetical protein